MTVTSSDNGDATLADGTPGSGVNPASVIAPATFRTSGRFTVNDQVVDWSGYAYYQARDDQSGLATPASGWVRESSPARGQQTLSVTAQDNVGHVTTGTCTYNVW